MSDVIVEARTRAAAADIWKLWTDVEGSPAWDRDVEWSRLYGAFEAGTRGVFKLKGGPRLTFILDHVAKERGYSNSVRLPGLSVRFTHTLEKISASEVRVVHGARLSGPIGWMLRSAVRKPLAAALAAALQNMIRLAENQGAPTVAH